MLKIIRQVGFQIIMRVEGFPRLRDEVRDFVGVPSLDDSAMEEFGVTLPCFEPLYT